MVPSRIEFENYHSYINRSFQTHRFGFATDGKTKPLCRIDAVRYFQKIFTQYTADWAPEKAGPSHAEVL
ncbi:hypothetical protein DWQ65_01660 [Treponema phagedenis]|uniref:Uncharacterized protein n=1 Tax=Treponema phagedenis TaxID=162 RepID=A0AAE6M736_TREPH|nr:hypothetical protein FUT79_01395 [Treponema phagedenis]QEJ97019.1 hypothetical protein FUT82_02805 [Treponema phagedenis]QEK01995.1 hypothetical protein FUT84_13030 [Treponema phagedenis]QEK02929.1 hypothetical protein FUT83_03285 [Treponema phagedenis]QEK07109.1 hypothetical protein FUT80_10510 [Treponema phagedenis]